MLDTVNKTNLNEFNLIEILNILYGHKFKVITFALSVGIFSIFYSLRMPDIFLSSSIVYVHQDVENDNESITNFSTGRSYNAYQNKTAIVLEVINSRDFIKSFLKNEENLIKLVAVKHWDKASNKLIINRDIFDPELNRWINKPTKNQIIREYRNSFISKEGKRSGLIEIGFRHRSPIAAKELTFSVINSLNIYINNMELKEIEFSIQKLMNNELDFQFTELKRKYSDTLEAKLAKIAKIKSYKDYPLKIIDSPIASDRKIRPRRSLIVLLSTILSGIFLSYIILIRHYMKSEE